MGRIGHFVVSAELEPDTVDMSFLALLASLAGAAFGNAQLHARELVQADELRSVVSSLEQSAVIHDRLTASAFSGGGQDGIAQALHALTGRAIAIEDRHGNLIVWAGPGKPDPYPRQSTTERSRMLRRCMIAGGPIQIGERLTSIVSHYSDVLGVVALIDPEVTTDESDHRALEYATVLLAFELTRLRNLAEDDVRLRGQLVMDLISGRGGPGVLGRAQSLDYDLGRPHRVVVIETSPTAGDSSTETNALRRVVRDADIGSLFVVQQDHIILLAANEVPWESFRAAVATELRRACRVGVGRQCSSPEDFPHSYREAEHALGLQKKIDAPPQVTVFDDLGIYQLLSDAADLSTVEELIRRWHGRLLDHDAQHGSQLVTTLGTYLDCGGRYDRTAESLFIHRNTLKYRLQRIREVSGLELGTPEVNFNLQLATRALRALQEFRTD
jgi:sugar diacid utilization regulator